MASKKTTKVVLTGEKGQEIVLDYEILRKAVLILRAVNHPTRMQIVALLNGKSAKTVTEIFVKLRLDQSVVSQHLAVLRTAGVLNTERNGKYIKYSLNQNRISEINQMVEELA